MRGRTSCSTLSEFHRPDAFEVDKISLHFKSRRGLAQAVRGTTQFLLLALGFQNRIAAETARQSAIRAAIRMQHQDHELGPMQADGFLDLVQNELAIRLVFRRRKTLGAACNLDRIRIDNSNPLEKLGKPELKPVIEAPDYGGVTMVFRAGSVEMKDLLHSWSNSERYARQGRDGLD